MKKDAMKFGKIIKFVIDSFIRHIKTNIMIILFLAVTAGIITRCFYVYYSNHYVDIKLRELYDGDLDKLYTVILKFDALDDKSYEEDEYAFERYQLKKAEFFKKLNLIEGVKGVGQIGSVNDLKDDLVIKKINTWEIEGYRQVYLDRYVIEAHELRLSNGQVIDEAYLESLGDEYDELWFYGPDIIGFEAGSVISCGEIVYPENLIEYMEENADYFEGKTSEENKTHVSERKVYVDSLERGNQFLIQGVLYGDSSDTCAYESLDDVVVIITTGKGGQYDANTDCILMLEADANTDECIQKISDLAKEYGCKFTYNKVSENRKAVNRKSRNIQRLYLEILLVVLIVGCMLAASIQITDIISDRKIYGVFYANGAYKRDIMLMMVLENVLRTVAGGLIGFYVTYKVKRMSLLLDVSRTAYDDISRYTFPYVILVLFVIMFLSCIVPYIVLRRYEPVDLIEGRME